MGGTNIEMSSERALMIDLRPFDSCGWNIVRNLRFLTNY
jgi:hypothetical protein